MQIASLIQTKTPPHHFIWLPCALTPTFFETLIKTKKQKQKPKQTNKTTTRNPRKENPLKEIKSQRQGIIKQ